MATKINAWAVFIINRVKGLIRIKLQNHFQLKNHSADLTTVSVGPANLIQFVPAVPGHLELNVVVGAHTADSRLIVDPAQVV